MAPQLATPSRRGAGVRYERSRPEDEREQRFRCLRRHRPAKRQLDSSWKGVVAIEPPEVLEFGRHAVAGARRKRLEPLIYPTANRDAIMARPVVVVGAVAVRGLHPQVKSAYQVFAAVRQALAKRVVV